MKPKGRKLTDREAKFVSEYLIDMNATQAAIRAGFTARSAYSGAGRLMKKDEVRAAIDQARLDQQERTLVTADEVLKRLDRIAMRAFTIGDLGAATRANELLGKHFKLFTEKHEHGGIGGGPVLFQISPSEADH